MEVIKINIKDLTGKKIGMLTLLERKRENNRTYYYCRCDCGNEKWIRADFIGKDKINNCGCSNTYRFNDITGKRFGLLTALRYVGMSKNNGRIWRCKCDCGNIKDIPLSNLTSGSTISCGCVQKTKAKKSVKIGFKKNKEKNLIEDTNVAFLKLSSPIKSNKSGVTGVCFNSRTNKWLANISFKKKRYFLGSFTNKEEAIKARKEAEEKLFKPFLESLEEE